MDEEDIVTYLKVSSKRAGRLYPVLLDRHGNVIDGMHRLTADKKWPKITIENIETEEQRLIARIISNVFRRHIPAKEKREMLGRLGEIYQKEGVEQGKIAYKIAEKTGMSYRWVMKYLPSSFKDEVQSERRAGLVARRATGKDTKQREGPKEIVELMEPPKEKILTIQKYANTHFVNVIVEKPFYTQLERMAEKLGTTPEVLLSNILLKGLKELEGRLEDEKK